MSKVARRSALLNAGTARKWWSIWQEASAGWIAHRAGQLESTFGAAASLVTILVWIYYSSQIVLFGAEFIRAYARQGQATQKRG